MAYYEIRDQRIDNIMLWSGYADRPIEALDTWAHGHGRINFWHKMSKDRGSCLYHMERMAIPMREAARLVLRDEIELYEDFEQIFEL